MKVFICLFGTTYFSFSWKWGCLKKWKKKKNIPYFENVPSEKLYQQGTYA